MKLSHTLVAASALLAACGAVGPGQAAEDTDGAASGSASDDDDGGEGSDGSVPADGDSADCPGSLVPCGSMCADTRVHPEHCGACGRSCAEDELCSDGQCVERVYDCTIPGSDCPAGHYCDQDSHRCELGCASDADCDAPGYCDGSHTCRCDDDALQCGGSCVPEDASACGPGCQTCPEVPNASPRCLEGECGFLCNAGFHPCGSTCVSNMGTDHCGDSCSPCPATHGAATCDGTSCGLQCDDGYHLEGSNCVVDCTDASCEPLQWCSESGACVQCIDPSGQSEPNDTLETADMMTFVNAANYQGQGRSCGSGDVDVWRVNLTYEPGEQVSWGFQATGDGAWWVEIYDGTNHLITDLCTVEDNCNVNIAFDNVIPNFNGPLYILVEHAGGTVPLDYWVYAYQG